MINYNKTYVNKLSNFSMRKYNTYLDVNEVQTLCFDGISNEELTKQQEMFNAVLEYYSDYITDKEKFCFEIWNKIESLEYINGGCIPDTECVYNKHYFIINGECFEYKTGCGINCQENKSEMYNRYKLIIDAIYCFISESANCLNYSEDDFLDEFGYTGSASEFKEGIGIFQKMKQDAKKIINIFGKDNVINIYNIMEL